MILEATEKVRQKTDLSREEMAMVMSEIMTGNADTAQIVQFLEALSAKGETIEEITAAAQIMSGHAVRISSKKEIVLDTCGTGGDKKGTFNISTITAFVVAGCGVTVAKHGNRAASSLCGSADILEAVGVKINMSKEKVERSLDEIGVAFLFAPNMHPAMKHAMEARKQIGKRTIFNILGPLCNPAKATHQLLGVFSPELAPVMAAVSGNLGVKHALVVHGKDGLDEITTTDNTLISEFVNGKVDNYEISPKDFGIRLVPPEDLLGGSAQDNAQIMLEVLNSKSGPARDIVILNSAAALYAADRVSSIKAGLNLAMDSIDSGRALRKLAFLKELSNEKN
ncbi:MAG: anthranilate phosphoribosyltransferase [Candidatus Omnitrophica bacterium]|nr:anthranilate phosphoribosyltransferase [Candidatus Omnitrophota bacterium]